MIIALGADRRGAACVRRLVKERLVQKNCKFNSYFLKDEPHEAKPGAFLIECAPYAIDTLDLSHTPPRVEPLKYSLVPDEFKVELPDGGETCDGYPDVAAAVAEAVVDGRAERGILVCNTGIGMCIVANKFKGIRAACCSNVVSAELSRRHNDANILCLSSDFLGFTSIVDIVTCWLTTDFDGDEPEGIRHKDRIELVNKLERETGL